jgi:hypothetical protein
MNGVRRFLGGGLPASNSPPPTPSDVSPLTITSKPSWPPSPDQTHTDSPAETPNQSPSTRKDRQRMPQSAKEHSGNMLNHAGRPINGTFLMSPTGSQPSFASLPSQSFSPNPPFSGQLLSDVTNQSSRNSFNSQDSAGNRTSSPLNTRDELLISLLASEAVVDSRGFQMLSAEEVDELKKAGSVAYSAFPNAHQMD